MGLFVQKYVVQRYVVQTYELLASLDSVFLWHRPGSPRLEDRVDDGAENDECTNPKEDRKHMFVYPSIGSQVGVVETIYYPRRGIYLTMCKSCLQL